MSTNIRILKYLNEMASTNMFGYSVVDFWTTKCIQILVCKFLKIQIYLNICSELYSNICLYFFNKKRKSRYYLCIRNIQYNIYFGGSMSETISKLSSISGIQIYLDICSVYMWYPNIFEYLFGTSWGIQIYLDIRFCSFYDICSSLRFSTF